MNYYYYYYYYLKFLSISILISIFGAYSPTISLGKQTRLNSNYVDLGKKYVTSAENPPFFPRTIKELAKDASFSVKLAIMSQISRIRIDVRLRITNRDQSMIEWLVELSHNLLDKYDSKVHLFIQNELDIAFAEGVLRKHPISHGRINISNFTEFEIDKNDGIFIIYNPDNLVSNSVEILEAVEAICFNSALKNIPVLITNPTLIATAWNDYGPRAPLLLSDFAQVYFICDNLFMMTKRDEWCGVVQRAHSGTDLFILSGLYPGKKAPSTYTRIESWDDAIPDNFRSTIARHLGKELAFVDVYERNNDVNNKS